MYWIDWKKKLYLVKIGNRCSIDDDENLKNEVKNVKLTFFQRIHLKLLLVLYNSNRECHCRLLFSSFGYGHHGHFGTSVTQQNEIPGSNVHPFSEGPC